MKVRYYGHVGAESGYGQAANELCMAMVSAGIELEIETTGDKLEARYGALAPLIRNKGECSPDPDVVIVHTLPLHLAAPLRTERIRWTCPKAVTVAYTTWEALTPPPAEVSYVLNQFDHVWAPSSVCAKAMYPALKFGAAVVPHPYDDEAPIPARDPMPNHWGNRPYRFYYVGAWNNRKNPHDVIRAYLRAFTKGEDVELHMHCTSALPTLGPIEIVAATGLPLQDSPPVHFTYHRMAEDQLANLRRTCDCFVSASRGEAWNLPAFEAMLAGNHLIVPAEQGSDEFLLGTSADRYPSSWVPAGGEVHIGTPGPDGVAQARYVGTHGVNVKSDWQQPDISILALRMRSAWAERKGPLQIDPASVVLKPELGAGDYALLADLPVRFGRRAVGQRILHLLESYRQARMP